MVKNATQAETRIALVGAHGRMGAAISTAVEKEFVGRAHVAVNIGRDNSDEVYKMPALADVILDVSAPAATTKFLSELEKQKAGIAYVIGCTGWTDAQLKTVQSYAKHACVVLAPNFSPGVNLFLGLIEQAAPLMKEWGYDVSIHETHHTRKLDSPSGTAKAIVERLGNMSPQVHATRAGNIVGTHEVRFIGENDILSLTHEALDRSIFARGAVMAAEWAASHKTHGLYSMKDVIFGEKP